MFGILNHTPEPTSQRGFTIVELLIVVVVIAILAAITIVSYSGIQNKANDSVIQNDLSMLAEKFLLYNAQEGAYPKGPTQLATLGVKLSTSSYSRGMFNGTSWYNVVYCWPNSANPDTFAIVAQSKSGTVFEAKNGGVRQVSYGLSGSVQTCSAAGIVMDSGNDRDWFYDVDAWRAYAK